MTSPAYGTFTAYHLPWKRSRRRDSPIYAYAMFSEFDQKQRDRLLVSDFLRDERAGQAGLGPSRGL